MAAFEVDLKVMFSFAWLDGSMGGFENDLTVKQLF
jgi:hypothetical protein